MEPTLDLGLVRRELLVLDRSMKLRIITAVIIPLHSPVILANLKVTHETVLAWLGSRPAGVGSIIKNVSTIPC